jgi:nicotinamidase/pyrazinamidase
MAASRMPSHNVILWEVDVQADFMLPGGRLYVPGAEKIIPRIKRLVDTVREGRAFLISSGDAHSPNDPEFQVFPPHCVKGTPGARILPEGLVEKTLLVPNDATFALPERLEDYRQIVIEKQTLDVFDNPKTSELIRRLDQRAEYILFGVVTEYCVLRAAKGLLERSQRVAIVTDAIETFRPEAGRRALDELQALGARLIDTEEALAEVRASERSRVAR